MTIPCVSAQQQCNGRSTIAYTVGNELPTLALQLTAVNFARVLSAMLNSRAQAGRGNLGNHGNYTVGAGRRWGRLAVLLGAAARLAQKTEEGSLAVRDYFFLAVLPFLLYAMFRRPFIALGMWIWTAMFFPNAWLYGIGSVPRYNLIFTAIAILGFLMLKPKPTLKVSGIFWLGLLFFIWTSLSSVMALGNPEVVAEFWIRFSKVMLLFLFVALVVEKKLHVDFFLWCVVFSIGFYGCLEAFKFILSGGGHKISGFKGHVLGDRNELSLAFVMTIPICYYLMREYGRDYKWIRLGLMAVIGLLVAAIIGTQSRGGFVALLGVGAYFFYKSDQKIRLGIGVAVLTLTLAFSGLVSSEWTSRMDSIQEAGEDISFMTRVVAWKLSFILAMHNPMFGGGFKAIEFFPVWSQLSQEFLSYPFFYTGDALPNPVTARAAHSIYFQVLGEHGFVGLAIYLSFFFVSFRAAGKVAKRARTHESARWIENLAKMFQVCLFSFFLGGAALNFAYFELMFAICALIMVLDKRLLPAAKSGVTGARAVSGTAGTPRRRAGVAALRPRA